MAGFHSEAAYQKEVNGVWKVTLYLFLLTVMEVGAALLHIYWEPFTNAVPKTFLNIFYVLATMAKAYYIVAEFMHLKHEKKVLMVTLGIPMIFLVWAIIAFMFEGTSWLNMKGLGGFGL